MSFNKQKSVPPFIKPNDNLVELVWGGNYIEQMKGLPHSGRHIGESWECSTHPDKPSKLTFSDGSTIPLTDYIKDNKIEILGRCARNLGDRLPIMVKFIDARENLSVQVHPSNDQAKELGESDLGKDEAWFILEREENAFIYLGLKENIDKDEFNTALSSPSIDIAARFLKAIPVEKGDIFFLPAGTLHSIGKGIVLFELGQTSSITYRVWDWNRQPKRQLHIQQALHVIDFNLHTEDTFQMVPRKLNNNEESLLESLYFSFERLILKEEEQIHLNTLDSVQIVSCIEGEAKFESDNSIVGLKRGQSLLVAATANNYTVSTPVGTCLLKASPGILSYE
ncbi:type I phosphomannose isomerase catalytic subunit [Chloroflexota bacterium]